MEKYYKECIKGKKRRNFENFPKLSLGQKSSPLTVVDKKGRIILWYLPELLENKHKVSQLLPTTTQNLTI
jgi:expansin (peptidoglycan-binding protein)